MTELDYLRLRNRFGQRQPMIGQPPPNTTFAVPNTFQPITMAPPTEAPQNGLGGLMNQPTPHLEEFKRYLANAPRREDYQLRGIGKLLAGAAGTIEGGIQKSPTVGINTGMGIMERPYHTALQEHEMKGSRLAKLAELERMGIKDTTDLAVNLGELNIKLSAEQRARLLANKTLDLNDARIKELEARAKNMGLSWGTNELTGEVELRDSKTGTITPIKQVMETPEQKREGQFSLFKREEGVRQGNRATLQEDQQAHTIALEKLRTANDADLARLNQELRVKDKKLAAEMEGMTPEAQRTAWTLAYNQTRTEMGDDLDPGRFNTELLKRLKQVRLRANIDVPTIIPGQPQVTLSNTVPQVQLPGTPNPASRAKALKELKELGYPNPSEAMIAEAIRDLGL